MTVRMSTIDEGLVNQGKVDFCLTVRHQLGKVIQISLKPAL
jgi:hypothetical protein